MGLFMDAMQLPKKYLSKKAIVFSTAYFGD